MNLDAIITPLGINWTTLPLLLIFLITLVTLPILVFRPYLKAYEEREHRTIGGHEEASRLAQQTEDLQTEFEAKAKTLNIKMRAFVDEARKSGQQESEQILLTAHKNYEKRLEEIKRKVDGEYRSAQESLTQHVPDLSRTIADQLLGK